MAHILLVEDDDDLRESLASLLGRRGFEVATAAHGADALSKLATTPAPDVIQLALMMPVLNGWEFRERQRQEPAIAGIPVIVFSAAAIEDPQPLGAVAVFRKPFVVDELVEVLRRYAPTRARGGTR
jgi:CheY-like chemotaxis protein